MVASNYPVLYGPTGNRLYPSPKDSPGKYRARPTLQREVKRSISQYDHAELVSISASLCCRIPTLRAAIRDKNTWAFANWLPLYLGDDEKWGEAAEEYLINEVLPFAMFRELRPDLTWGMRVSGMGLDMHGDDLAIFTEDEAGNPRLDIIPAPRIGNGPTGMGWQPLTVSAYNYDGLREDGMGEVKGGAYDGAAIYNGVIRKDGRPVAVRVLGYDASGKAIFSDIPLGASAHYACEMEFFGQGRGLPRPASSVLSWMQKEEIDSLFLAGLKLAASKTVIHQVAPGADAATARGNAIERNLTDSPKLDAYGNAIGSQTEAREVFVEYLQEGNVTYIGSDENLSGLSYDNPHSNSEAFAVRVLTECLADLGWSYELLDLSGVSRAPTRLVTQKANNAIWERQSIQESRSVRFFQHAIAKGMAAGRIPWNRNGLDPYKWGVGFPATMTVDQGNDVTAALDRLKMGLTNERIEAAKDGHVAKRIRQQREKEIMEIIKAADRSLKFARSLGHEEFTFDKAMALHYQTSPNPPSSPAPAKPSTPAAPTP